MTRRDYLRDAVAGAVPLMDRLWALAAVRDDRYKDVPSFVIESDLLRAEFVAAGARMVSLRDKRSNLEFLHQQTGPNYIRGNYDRPMSTSQAAGYDDMFPTIAEGYVSEFPWNGIRMPDHGEAWALDWDVERSADTLNFSVRGVRLPYRLARAVTVPASNRLRMAYRLENLSPYPMSYLWSAHPMLRPEEGSRILLPEECRVANVGMSHSGRLGNYGNQITWPNWIDSRGGRHDLSRIRSADADDTEAYYFTKPLVHGQCALTYPSVHRTLRLSFPVETVPFLGIVLGEGVRGDSRFFALLEPCSVPFARLDTAQAYTQDSKVPAKGTREWFLEFKIEDN
jgi:hypothetical protein